ncbi:hypothetical protein JCM5353_006609 [Sporobolomyces roseus]
MRSQLPVELLGLIFDNFACPAIAINGTLENPHRHELLSLCLTSKIFRQIAQPLLFAVVSFEGPTEDIEPGLKRLVKADQQSRLLQDVRLLLLKGKSAVNRLWTSTGVLVDLIQACTLLEEMICTLCTLQVKILTGSSLRKLCLTDTDFERQVTTFCLPSLHSLSLVDVDFPEQGFSSTNFPSLRHFAYDQHEGVLSDAAGRTLVALAPQLISIVLLVDIAKAITVFDTSFPLHSVLVDHLSGNLDYMNEYARDRISHARIRIDVALTANCSATVVGVNQTSLVIEEHTKCRKLESIYLPPLDSLETSTRPISVRQAVDRLILACQERSIEIVHDEQPTKLQAETQLSEEFMRRMTKKRMERESTDEK